MRLNGIKYLLLLSCLATVMHGYGQKITGVVVDKATKQPLSGALVSLGNSKTYTNNLGRFEIEPSAVKDSLRIVYFTYKPYRTIVPNSLSSLLIELEPSVISLNTVTVHGERDFKKDSINNRLAYAKQFNYTGPKIMDAFTGSPEKQPGELLSVNLLVLVEALTKKSTPEYKFHKILLRDEQAQYVDRSFNRGNVSKITGLQGDTLSMFLVNYRPTYDFAKRATEYDMVMYIKASFEKLKKGEMKETNPFAKKD